jgi:hypothetical protein
MNTIYDLAVGASLCENRRQHHNCGMRHMAENGAGEPDTQEICMITNAYNSWLVEHENMMLTAIRMTSAFRLQVVKVTEGRRKKADELARVTFDRYAFSARPYTNLRL